MPETYTQEQIDALKKKYAYLTRAVDKYGTKRRALAAGNWKGEGGPDLSEEEIDVAILLSALSTAERERDALKAQVAELEAKLQGAGWINVDSDKRPPEDYSLLVVVDNKYKMFARYKNGVWTREGVTHWMPLPEPPSIVGKKEG